MRREMDILDAAFKLGWSIQISAGRTDGKLYGVLRAPNGAAPYETVSLGGAASLEALLHEAICEVQHPFREEG